MELEFGDLPYEIMALIFQYLGTGIHIAKDVCRLWRELCLSQYVLRNIGTLIGVEYYQCIKKIDVGSPVISLITVGNLVVSGDGDANINIWDLDGNHLGKLFGHSNAITSLFVIDDNLIASGSRDNTARIWDLSSMKCVCYVEKINSICVINDNIIGTNTESGLVEIWNFRTGLLEKEYSDDAKWTVSVWNKHERLVNCDPDGTITIWDPQEERTHRLSGHLGHIECIYYEPGLMITGGIDQTIRVWEYLKADPDSTPKWICSKTLTGHSDWINKLLLVGDKIISASDDNTIRVWDLNTGNCLKTLEGHSDFIQSVEYSTYSGKIISAGYDHFIMIWGFEN